jgi:hypothetical protein
MSEIKVDLSPQSSEETTIAQREEMVLQAAVDAGEIAKENVEIEPNVVKLDLRNFNKDKEVVVEQQVEQVIEQQVEQVIEEDGIIVVNQDDESEETIIQEVNNQEEEENIVTQQPSIDVPENLQELIKFMQETGGTLEDYVKLNKDYSSSDEESLLREYYKKTRANLSEEEIDFLIEDEFSWDEDYDDEKTIRKRKLALKQEVDSAKKYLSGLKEEYYKEVKLTPKLKPEEREAIEFYNKYNKEQELSIAENTKRAEHFQQETKKLFEDFKGFDFAIGDKKFRYAVKNPEKVMQYQSDVNNLVKEFVKEDGSVPDIKGWHKALFMAKNGDALMHHFYEQGKADAVKENAIVTKNIDMDIRPIHKDPISNPNGFSVRAVDVDPGSKLKIKFGKK